MILPALVWRWQKRRSPAGTHIQSQVTADPTLVKGASRHRSLHLSSWQDYVGRRHLVASVIGQFWFNLPLEAERGYHLLLRDPGIELNNSIMDADGKYVASSMDAGIRIAGTAEFSGLDTAPNYARARRFAKQARQLFPRINCDQPRNGWGSSQLS